MAEYTPASSQPGQLLPGNQPIQFPPGNQPIQPPPATPGYHPGMQQTTQARPMQNIGTTGNLPPTQVTWMPAPPTSLPNCPPGLEYLTQIDQILVHQEIELLELVSNFETENKYRIRNTLGQQVYFAAEHSSVFQRQCCGAGRAFSMSIIDNQEREVIHLKRPLQCHWNWYFCCSSCAPRGIEVESPPGTVVGYVKQDSGGILRPQFFIMNADEEVVLKIKGPICGCNCYSDSNFVVTGVDGTNEVGKITKQWGGLAKEHFTDADNFGIQFPMDLDVKIKAVLLGACFLIDFMFFERPANNGQNQGHRRQY